LQPAAYRDIRVAMNIRYQRPVSNAARLSRRFGQTALLLCLGALVVHRFGLLATPHMVFAVGLSATLAAVAVVCALIGLQRLWQVGALGGVKAMKGLAASALPLALVALTTFQYMTAPPVADVTTDHADRPEWLTEPRAEQGFLPKKERSSEAAARELAAYPELIGRRYEGALDRVYRAVTKVADAEGIDITAESGVESAVDIEDSAAGAPAGEVPAAGGIAETPDIGPVPLERPQPGSIETPRDDVLIQGEKKTLVLGLPFDILIRLREDAETTTVDVRVASRYGASDLGFGAEIAESYLRALDAELLGIAGD
jgi:hypothetical protein